jgi:hypothetical protein
MSSCDQKYSTKRVFQLKNTAVRALCFAMKSTVLRINTNIDKKNPKKPEGA